MRNRPFTIQTYFPDGDTRGYKISQIPTRTIQSIYIPRADLDLVIISRNELAYNGLYFLFEEDELLDDREKIVYIGESENVAKRLKSHSVNKIKWETAVVFTTTGEENQLTKADIKYLENYCYEKALEVDRYKIDQNTPTKSFVNESREADLMDLYKTISDLLVFLGYPLFLPKQGKNEMRKEDEYYFLSNHGSDGKAIYSKDGMLVTKGTKIASNPTNSFPNMKLLNRLKELDIINKDGVFTKDYIFSSPSTAAAIVSLASSNGWTAWKNKDGKTLDDNVSRA